MTSTATDSGQTTQSARLARTLRHLIVEGRFSPDQPLPSHRELAASHGVGVQVVRSALAMLVDEGVVQKHARRGVFIKARPGQAAADKPSTADRKSSRKAGNAARSDKRVTPLRCITFLERASGTTPGFVRSEYLHGFSEALDGLDIRMRFAACPPEPARWENLLSPHLPLREQGCVLINLHSPALMKWLDDHGVAYVLQSNKAYAREDLPAHHGLFINKMRGGFETASHLISLGHQRIGFVGDVHRNYHEQHDVYSGCVAAVSYAGLQIRSDDVLSVTGSDLLLSASPLRQYLKRSSLPSAIVAQNDSIALLLMRIARDMGMNLPGDLSITGYDNLPEGEQAIPALTSFISPRVMLGKTAVAMLLEAAVNPGMPKTVRMIEGQLIVRQSTAPPRASAKGRLQKGRASRRV